MLRSRGAASDVPEGERVSRYEKRPRDARYDGAFDHIDYGATALRREVVEGIPEGIPWDLASVQRALSAEGTLRAYVAERRFFEIGSEEGLGDLEAELASLASSGGPR